MRSSLPVVEIEGVLLVARRVVGGRVERVETMKLVLDFRAVGQRETHPAEDADRLVADQRERVQRSGRYGARRQGDVDTGERGMIGEFGERGLFFLKRGGDRAAGGVEKLADLGLVLLRHVAHAGGGEGQGALFAEHGDAHVF